MSIFIDTIHILLPNQNLSNFSEMTGNVDLKTGELKYSVGYSDCIKVRRFNGLMKIECSLPKLLKGENIYTLTFSEILQTIKMIGNKLEIDISEGKINRIDLCMQHETEYSASNYFRYLGQSKNYKVRTIVNESSLYYQNKISRKMYFYDKILEMKHRKVQIPVEFRNKNITRIEVRYNQSFIKNIFKKDLFVKDLENSKVFMVLADNFLKDYLSINKENKLLVDISKISSKKDLMTQLAIVGIDSLGGATAVIEMLDASRKLNKQLIRSEYASRRKAEVKEIANCLEFIKPISLIEELNSKVELAYKNTAIDVIDTKSET